VRRAANESLINRFRATFRLYAPLAARATFTAACQSMISEIAKSPDATGLRRQRRQEGNVRRGRSGLVRCDDRRLQRSLSVLVDLKLDGDARSVAQTGPRPVGHQFGDWRVGCTGVCGLCCSTELCSSLLTSMRFAKGRSVHAVEVEVNGVARDCEATRQAALQQGDLTGLRSRLTGVAEAESGPRGASVQACRAAVRG
jgi:hypothetical protein